MIMHSPDLRVKMASRVRSLETPLRAECDEDASMLDVQRGARARNASFQGWQPVC